MKRRNFVAGVLLAATIPHAQGQQRSKVYRVAFATPSTPITEMNEASGYPLYPLLFEELKRLGYIDAILWWSAIRVTGGPRTILSLPVGWSTQCPI